MAKGTGHQHIYIYISLLDQVTPNLVLLSYLLCAILTTAFVTAFTPNTGQRHVEYRPLIVGSKYAFTTTGDTQACAGVAANTDAMPPQTYGWPFDNGKVFFAAYGGDCTASRVVPHISNINSLDPEVYTYVDSGVAVHRSSMGASALLYRGQSFQRLSKENGRSLKRTSQCVPVMTSNPVSCKKGKGTLQTMEQDNYLNLTVDFGDYQLSRPVGFARNFTRDSAMVNYLWVDRTGVGRAHVVFSAYNSPTGAGLFAQDLARVMNDPDENAGTEPGSTYIVVCSVHPENVFEYRRVELDVQASGGRQESKDGDKSPELQHSRFLKATGPCTPAEESVGLLHHTAAAIAHYKMAMENFGYDGHFTTVYRIAGRDRKPPYAFNQSQNGLEDALGVISALGVANLRAVGDNSVVADGEDDPAEAVVDIEQLGYDNRLMLLLVLAPLLALTTLVYFFCMSFKAQYQPGGGIMNIGGQEWKGSYASESITELITPKLSDENIELTNQSEHSGLTPSRPEDYEPLAERDQTAVWR